MNSSAHQRVSPLRPLPLTTAQLQNGSNSHSENSSYNENQRQQTQRPLQPEFAAKAEGRGQDEEVENLRTSGSPAEFSESSARSRDLLVKRTTTGTFSTGTIAGEPDPFLDPLPSKDSHESPQMNSLNFNVLSAGEQISSSKSGRSENEEEVLRSKQTNRPNTPLTATSDPSSTPLPVVAAVSEIPCTPVTVTPSLTANPRELQPLPIKAAARLTNPTMERLAKEAAAKQFRADILKARVPAPNVIVNDIDEIDLLSTVGGGGNTTPVRGGSEAFNAAVNATSPANKPTKALVISSSAAAAAAASSPSKRRKGKGVVTVLNGLRQSLTGAGVLLFAGYTPSILQAVPTAHMSPSRSKEGNDKVRLHLMLKARRRSRSLASSTTSSNMRARRESNAAESTSSVNMSAMLADTEEDRQVRSSHMGEAKWSAAVEASRSRQGVAQQEERERPSYVQTAESSFMNDPVDDLMSLQKGDSAHTNSPNRKAPKNLFQVTSSRTAPAVGTSRLNPLLKAVRLQQTLLSQDLPLPILHADDGIDLAWVQKFIVDDVVYAIYQGAQLDENFITKFNKQLEREEREKDSSASAKHQDHNTSQLQQQQRYPPSPYPLLDFLLQRGTTAPIRFHSSGRDIPLEILQRAAAGDPIVLAEDEAGFDDMGESVTYGKRNLVDFLKWRVRTVGKWASEAKEKGVEGFEEGLAASSKSPRRLLLPGSSEISEDVNDRSMTERVDNGAPQKTSSVSSRKEGRGLTLILGGADERRDNAYPEDDDDDASLNHFGAIDSPRSALVCFRHGLRVSSWYTLRTPQGLARRSPQRRRPNNTSSIKEESRPVTRGQSSGSLSSSQAKAIASAITSESMATDSLLPIVEDYKILCKTITQKFAIYVMTMAALDHLTARVPIPRNWAEVSGAALRGVSSGGSTPRRGGGAPILALTNGSAVEEENMDDRLRVLLEAEARKNDRGVRSGHAEVSENESPKKDTPVGGRAISLQHGLVPSPTSTNRGLGHSLKTGSRQLTPLISDKRPLTSGFASAASPTQIIASMSPQRAGAGPFLQPLSVTTSTALVTTQSSSGGQGQGQGNARTPMADLLQRSHDDLLIEWAKRQQNFARELYTDRRVAKAVEQRRAEKIKKARDCQTPLQLRMAAEREERIERELAAREAERKRMRKRRSYGGKQQRERRRRSTTGGDDDGEASEGSESDVSTISGQERHRQQPQQQHDNLHNGSSKWNFLPFTSQKGGGRGGRNRNAQTIIEEMEAEAERAYRARRGPGAGGSRYHPDRYVPLLASSSDEDLDEISMCSHSSCSECEITRRRRERKWAKAGGKTTTGAATTLGGKVRVALPGNTTSTDDAFDSTLLGGNVTKDSGPVPNSANTSQETKREKGAKRDRQQQPQRLRSSSPLASALYLVNNPSASPSEVFLEMQREREQERVAQRLASVERKERMIEEASKRRVEAFQEHRHRNELGKAKAEEVNARLERKLLFGKLLMANKSHQQEHKDAQKKALAKERAKQVSAETKAKGALASRSREVFEQARVAVHKSLYLQEKLNTDYRAKSHHGEYHHHANVSVSPNNNTTTPTRIASSPLVVASPTRTNDKGRSPRGRGGEEGSMRVDTTRSLSSSSPPMSPNGLSARGGSPRGPHALATVSSSSSKPSTSAIVEDMFNQAIDARKAVSRNALTRHLSSQRAIVKRWQELEGTMYEAHSNLKTLQSQGQGPLQKH